MKSFGKEWVTVRGASCEPVFDLSSRERAEVAGGEGRLE